MPKRIFKFFFYLIFFYGLIGFLLLPWVLKPKIVELVQANTNAKIAIGTLYINPFTFSAQLSGVELKMLDKSKLFKADTLFLNIDPSSLVHLAFHIKNVTLGGAKLSVKYGKDDSLNLFQLMKPSPNQKTEQDKTELKIPRIIIDTIAIQNSKLGYEDYRQKKSFVFSLDDISFALQDIDTKNMASSDAQFKINALLSDGSLINLKSKIVSYKPFKIKGNLFLQNIQLYTLWKYFQKQLKVEVADGRVTLSSDFYFDGNDINTTLLSNISIKLDKLRIKPKDTFNDILLLSSVSLEGGKVRPFKNSAELGKISANDLFVEGVIDTKGSLNLIDYLEFNKSRDSKEKAPTTPWKFHVESINLKNLSMNLVDKSIKPIVTSTLNKLDIHVDDFALSGDKMFTYKIFLRANKHSTCKATGQGVFQTLETNTSLTCKDFDLLHYKPYIDNITQKSFKKFDFDLVSASLGFDGNIITNSDNLQLSGLNVNLDDLAVNKKSTKERLLDFDSLMIRGINIDTKKEEIDVGYGVINSLHVNLKKYKNGSMNIENLLASKAAKKEKSSFSYHLKLKHVALKSGRINFDDLSMNPYAKYKIDRLACNGYDIDSDKYSWINYNVYARVNSKGVIRSKAKLRLNPFKQRGSFSITDVAIKDINPYLQNKSYIKVAKGSASLRAHTSYEKSLKKADLHVSGSVSLKNVQLNDSRDVFNFASLSALKINKFIFELSPNSLSIDAVDIDKFAVNTLVSQDKKLNLTTLVKKSNTSKEDTNRSNFLIKIDKVRLHEGIGTVSDLSMTPLFKTDIQSVKGVVYNFSNIIGYTTYINLSGELPKSGFLHFEGSTDMGSPKLYTTLDVKLQNLDLHSISPYSYLSTGYALDNGKLYMGSKYDVSNSQLKGKNNIVINNIELGKVNPDQNATHLPLGLAVGLLEDANGVIDINMPVEGNIDNPDFKYGGLVIKTFTKLIFGVVTSPFSLLGKMLALDTDKLSSIHFNFGSYELTQNEKKKLDTIATIMTNKPKISLSVTGVYDTKLDGVDEEKIEIKKLEALASKRAQVIINYLIKEKGINPKRVLDNGVSFTKVPKEGGVASTIEIILSVL